MPQLPVFYHVFRNAWSILRFLEREALLKAGVLGDAIDWELFQDNPPLFLLGLDDIRAAALWAVVEAQLPMELQQIGRACDAIQSGQS